MKRCELCCDSSGDCLVVWSLKFHVDTGNFAKHEFPMVNIRKRKGNKNKNKNQVERKVDLLIDTASYCTRASPFELEHRVFYSRFWREYLFFFFQNRAVIEFDFLARTLFFSPVGMIFKILNGRAPYLIISSSLILFIFYTG